MNKQPLQVPSEEQVKEIFKRRDAQAELQRVADKATKAEAQRRHVEEHQHEY